MKLYDCVRSSFKWEAPQPPPNTRVTVGLHIAADGTFRALEVTEPSTLPTFDSAALAAVRACDGVITPREQIRQQLMTEGLELTFGN